MKQGIQSLRCVRMLHTASHSVPSSSSLTPNIPLPFTAIPQHTVISTIHCAGYTALLLTFWNRASYI